MSSKPEPYMPPAFGIDAFRDAAAAIRCIAAADPEGVRAVFEGTERLVHVAFALASVSVIIASRVGMTGEQLAALLADISTGAADALLDQPRPHAASGGDRR